MSHGDIGNQDGGIGIASILAYSHVHMQTDFCISLLRTLARSHADIRHGVSPLSQKCEVTSKCEK